MKQFDQRSRGKARLALTAGLVLAMAFTVSCSGDDGGNGSGWSPGGGGGGGGSSSSDGGGSGSGDGGGGSSSSAGGTDPALVRQTIVLSYAGTSYADLDATPVATYQQAAASLIKNKIDLVAFNGQTTANAIYAPLKIDFFRDGYYNYLGGSVSFFPLPAAGVAAIRNATKSSELSSFYEYIYAIPEVYEIAIEVGAGFLVLTTDGEVMAVIITSVGTQAVTLSITKIPL